MDDVDRDNERHRREQQELRAKRKAHKARGKGGKSERVREHVQKVLRKQAGGAAGGPSPRRTSSSASSSSASGGSSAFRGLFSERAGGFSIDLRFRNAPPRPPVGPAFVGLGLEGELTDKWTRYKARNAVERQYRWPLHPPADLGVPLGVSAMDVEGGCYADLEKVARKESSEKQAAEEAAAAASAAEGGTPGGGAQPPPGGAGNAYIPPTLHPDDEALIRWRGPRGDTSAELLQQRRDRARAEARLAVARGRAAAPAPSPSGPRAPKTGGAPGPSGPSGPPSGGGFRLKAGRHAHSRILAESIPHFMKKTTYLTNDATSVHRFTSLAHTRRSMARDVDEAVESTRRRLGRGDAVEDGFAAAASRPVRPAGGEGPEAGPAGGARSHPTKRGVTAVWDLPLLPDAAAWGHSYTHVVVDNPPRVAGGDAGGRKRKKKADARGLGEAIVADVTRQEGRDRIACTVWVPDDEDEEGGKKEGGGKDGEEPTAKRPRRYAARQRYDLDVVPLRDASAPPVVYVLSVRPGRPYAAYRPVGSRIHLSTGRPVPDEAPGRPGRCDVSRREAGRDESDEFERRAAEVDADLAEKHGLVRDGDGDGGADAPAGGGGEAKDAAKDVEEDDEEDAF